MWLTTSHATTFILLRKKSTRNDKVRNVNSREEKKSRLNEIFQEVFDDDEIEIFEDMTAEDIDEWDSLNHIVLIVAIEKQFGLKLNAAEVGNLKNVGEFLTLLDERATL